MESKIRFLKNHVGITVYDDEDSSVAQLVPVNDRTLMFFDNACELSSDWRNRFQDGFLTRFTATPERTLQWLQNEVIPRNDKILFFIVVDGTIVGHIGLTDITADNAEIDNVVNTYRQKSFFYQVLHTVVQLCFDMLSVKKITIRYLSENAAAVRAYGKIFQEKPVRIDPMRRIQTGDMVKYIVCGSENADVDTWYLTSELAEESFRKQANSPKRQLPAGKTT